MNSPVSPISPQSTDGPTGPTGPTSPSSLRRIDGLALVDAAIRTLASYGFDLTSVRQQHASWLAARDLGTPTDHDHRWATREAVQRPISEHYLTSVPPLSALSAWPGRQFTLTPGQRDVLRERYGLTPARTVEILDTTTFVGTTVLHSLTLRSCEHIDERRRTHVLNQVVLRAADFFDKSAAADAARATVDETGDANSPQSTATKVKARGLSRHAIVLSYLGD